MGHTTEKNLSFLREEKLFGYDIVFNEFLNFFEKEMELSLTDKNSVSRSRICYTTGKTFPERNKKVIVVDAGGTNLRIATGFFDDNFHFVIAKKKEMRMPGSEKEISFDEFIDFLCLELSGEIVDSAGIGICFSYDFEATKTLDACLLSLSKEVSIRGTEGKFLGKEIKERLSLNDNQKIAVLNDTTASLVGGRCLFQKDCKVSFVLGTGVNLCYIGKISGEETMINTEAGGYHFSCRGEIERELDKNSEEPGMHLLEKSLSGKYLEIILKETIKKAKNRGLIEPIPPLLCEFSLKKAEELMGVSEDLFFLIDAIYEKCARISAAMIAAGVHRAGIVSGEAFVVLEGSTILKSKILLPKIEKILREYLSEIAFHFMSAEDLNLIGVAAVVL